MGETHNTTADSPQGEAAAGNVASAPRAGTGAAPASTRAAAKAARRLALLESAKRLFASRGFSAVSLQDVGRGAGVSGPAVYRHFESKEAILSELLIDISQYLYDGGERIVSTSAGREPGATLHLLVDFHLAFTTSEPELIRIQDRDWSALPQVARRTVRKLQRAYVSFWVGALRAADPELGEDAATVRAHAVFGMLNSTPYVVRRRPAEVVEAELRAAALLLLQA